MGDCKLYFSYDKTCCLYQTTHQHIAYTEESVLICNHEDADTSVVLHLMHTVDISKTKTVVIRSSDTDVLVILTYHVSALSRDEATVFMDVGHDGNNNKIF